MDQPVLSFRSSFWWSFWILWRWGTFCGTALTLALTSALGFNGGWDAHLLMVLASGLAGGLAGGLILTLAVAYFPVYVAEDGIKGYDFFGFYHFAPWLTIERIRPINLLGLRYLRVRSSAAPRELWVPLFLADMPGFCAAVADRAGPDHPLAEALQVGHPSPENSLTGSDE